MKILRTITLYVLLASTSHFVTPPVHAASWGAVGYTWVKPVGFISAQLQWGWPAETDRSVICNEAGGCIVTVGPWDPRGGPPYGGINNPTWMTQRITVPMGTRTVDAFEAWTKIHGRSGESTQSPMWAAINDLTTTCYGFQVFDGTSAGPYRTGRLLPGTTCGKVPEPTRRCDDLDALLFDYGTISSGQGNGERLVLQRELRCSNVSSVSFRLASPLRLSSTLTASLSVNTKPITTSGVTLEIKGGSTPLVFTSTLSGTEKRGGNYTASSVMIMEFF